MKGLFITGTDTDAGKTTVTAALLRALMLAGVPAAAVKPVQTGCVMRGGEEENRGEEGTFLKKAFLLPPPPPKTFVMGTRGEKAASVKSLFCMGDMDALRKKSGGVHVILLRATPPLLAKKQSQNIITPSIKEKAAGGPASSTTG